jgi:uncharacterized protein (TIGR03435 family)
VLVVGKNGPKLPEAKPEESYGSGMKGPDGRPVGRPGHLTVVGGQLTGQGIPIEALVVALSQEVGRIVVDQTGLKGKYDIALQSTPDRGQVMFKGLEDGKPATDNALPPDSSAPSIFTAVQEQLGLKLISTKGPVEVLAIDHIERPSDN